MKVKFSSSTSLKHRVLRPANFLTIIITSLAMVLGFTFLLIIVFIKPYEETQDLRQQAMEMQDCLTIIDLPRGECEALGTLYESTNGAGWTLNSGEVAWFTTPRACEWVGIACSGNPYLERPEPLEKNVVGINLPSRRMNGPLPPVWEIFDQLTQIDLSNNNLTGSIENSGLLTLKNLVSINLSNNKLDGYLADVFSGDHLLVSLDISRNTGVATDPMPLKPLPTSLAKVRTLKQLILNNTLLGEPIPTAFSELSLNIFLTANTNLCLPDGLKAWYEAISKTNNLRFCSATVPTLSPTPTKTPTPSPTGRPSATPTPTATSGTGGTTIVGCNQSCESNANCSTNLRCYDVGGNKRCRLATNPANESCQGIPDQGLNFACNEYCSDSSECAGDLTCWYNRCREAANVSSVSCTPPDADLNQLMQDNCGDSCSSNRDCVINMRCYSGSCRLATNPTSQSCAVAPPTKRTAPTASQPKGGIGNPSITPALSSSPKVSPTATEASESAVLEPSPTAIIPITQTPPEPENKSGLFDQIRNWFSQLKLPEFDSSGISNVIQSKGLLIGLVIAGIVFLLLGIFTGKKKNTPKASSLQAPPTIRSSQESSSGMIDRIKQKGITPLK